MSKKKRISVKSAKAKGRKLQNLVASKISDLLGIPCGRDKEIASRPMGQGGTDVILYGEAAKRFKFSIEAKNCERWTIPKWIKQAKELYKTDEFVKKYTELTESFIVGDPMDRNTSMGPLVTNEQRMKLQDQVGRSVNEGAKILVGGNIPEGKGFFYEPTILTDVTNKMPVFKEETFGPVSPILVVESEEEAIREANNSEFGLGASLWTRDVKHGEEIARNLEHGNVAINKDCKSDPRLPFGGVKNSGYGREMGRYGLLEFVNIKSMIIGK